MVSKFKKKVMKSKEKTKSSYPIFQLNSQPPCKLKYQQHAIQILDDLFHCSKSLPDFAQFIQQSFTDRHGPGWQVIVGKDLYVDIRYRIGSCLVFTSSLKHLKVIVYRPSQAQPSQWIPTPSSISSMKLNPFNLIINETTGTEEFQEHVLKLIKEQVIPNYQHQKNDIIHSLSTDMKNILNYSYGISWHVVTTSNIHQVVMLPEDHLKDSYMDITISFPTTSTSYRLLFFQHLGYYETMEKSIEILHLIHRICMLIGFAIFSIHTFFYFQCPQSSRSLQSLWTWTYNIPQDTSYWNMGLIGWNHMKQSMTQMISNWMESNSTTTFPSQVHCEIGYPLTFLLGMSMIFMAIFFRGAKVWLKWKSKKTPNQTKQISSISNLKETQLKKKPKKNRTKKEN